MAKARQQYFADETTLQKESREFAITPDIINKLDSIETGAQVNVIETVKVNGTALVPDANKAVNVEVPDVIDNLFSTSTDDALSAKQGKVLYDYLQNIASRGRYLSNWNCVTGLAITNPSESPYPYKSGDYFVVSNVAGLGGTNYRPDGTQYIIGQASTVVETDNVDVSDFYFYDGTTWLLLKNSSRSGAVDSALSTTSTNPVENRVVTNAINGKQDTLVAGTNIQIASDGKTISATDTTYSAGTNISIDANNEISAVDTTYTAGANIQISNQNVISATDTVYAAGTNVQINNNVISATDTTYTAGTGISIDSNNVISNTQTSAEWGNITGTLSDQTDLQDALDAKQDDMVVLSYGHSTRNDFINAYNKNAVVFCKASKNNDPSTGTQNRFAVLATPNTSLTYVEFNYYRSISSHSSSQQCDQVIVYKLTNAGVWSYEERETSSKIVAGTNMSSSYSSGELTLNASAQYDDTAYGTSWDGVTDKAPSKNAIYDKISAMDVTIAGKQDTLTAGDNITITSNTISAIDTTYAAGDNITIRNVCSKDTRGPCPEGFHIPTDTEIQALNTVMQALTLTTYTDWVTYLKMPLPGVLANFSGSIADSGTRGRYWTSVGDSTGFAFYLNLSSAGVNVYGSLINSYGFSIRPFKDTVETPDSGWTVLYQGSGSAGIYHNSTLGLISISSDGTNFTTISDKNVGATTVYNSGDALTSDNCGGLFQWGNNNAFSISGATTTSSTQVDASNYGPGNYYSSDTFITTSGQTSWNSPINKNLWGGETQGTSCMPTIFAAGTNYIAGTGISITNGTIANTGVTSVNGQTGAITVSSPITALTTNTSSYDFQGNIDPGTYVLTSSGKYLEIAASTYVQVNGSSFTTSGRGLWLYNDTDDWTYIDGKYIIRMYGTGTSYSVLPFEINVQAFTISSTSDTSIGYQVLTTSQQPIVVYNNCAYILKSSSKTGSSMSYTKTMVFESPADISGTTISYNTLTFVLTHSLITDTVTITAGSASATAGDMNYSDFNWSSKTGATITLDLASTISPSADFTVNAPSTIKDGQTYILRVNNEGTAYEMTLGTNVTNPYDTDITLTDDGVDQFVFLAINGELELQPEGGGGGGGLQVSPNSTITGIKYIRYGTEADYANLSQYYTDVPGDTEFHTF